MTIDAKYLGLTANQLAKIATDLKAENAKLRELVFKLYGDKRGFQCMREGGEKCEHINHCLAVSECPYEELMNELGIEVEDDN